MGFAGFVEAAQSGWLRRFSGKEIGNPFAANQKIIQVIKFADFPRPDNFLWNQINSGCIQMDFLAIANQFDEGKNVIQLR
jgi:hypothetical protein